MAENLDSVAPSVFQRRVEIVSAVEKGQEMSKNDPVSLSETGNFSCSDSIQEKTKINLLFDSEGAQSRAFSAVEEKIQEVEKTAETEVERILGAPNGFEMTEKTKETVEEEKEMAELEPRLVLEAHTEYKKTTQIKKCKEISGSLENNKPESKEVMGSFENNKTENILEEKVNCVSEAHFSDLSNSSNVSEEALNSSSDVSEIGKVQENKGIQNIDPTSVPNFGKGTFHKNAKSEMVKCSRRKGKAKKNGLEVNGKQNGSSLLAGVVVSESMGEGSKRMYSRRDMEALRFVNVSEQKEMWNEIYKVLVSVLGQKLDQIAYFKNQKRGTMNDDRRVRLGRKNVAAPILGQMLMDDHPTLFWTPCAAHCIDLMLHDICKLPIITTTVKRAIALNGYIYNHPYVLNMMRTFTEQKELIRPGVTRFATVFLTLQSIYNQKNKLRRMFTSEEWSTSRYHRDTKGKDAYETVLSPGFWNNILYSLRATGPLVRVLRMVDSEKRPAMGYIYEAMDRAKEAISKSFNYNEAKYYEIWEIIDKRWNDQLHRPLHAAGYYLNPEYFYTTPRIESNEELNDGFLKTMARLVPDEGIQDLVETELSLYRYAQGVMGSPNAIRNRALWSPGEACFQNLEASPEKGGSSVARDGYLDGVDDIAVVDEISEADEDSDSEYYSIQRPAFYVEGEPDFESGPPQDGLEYLRRVRWEAAQCPKIKVAKIGTSKLCYEQTPYMPNIPEIARCQEHLLPSKQWEDTFLEDFSQMRLDLTVLENSIVENSHFPLPVISMEEDLKEVAAGNLSKTIKSVPMLSAILGMEIVSRASMLRSRIRSLETESTLSRENCLWIYALCVAVDTPFDSDMSASMRSLLRKCASLRAEKLEFDDELAMLNMLVTIAGRYFGQLESPKCWVRES